MSERKSLFSRAFEAIVEARSREAERYVEQYRRAHATLDAKRVTGR
jgi:hypothetical protein